MEIDSQAITPNEAIDNQKACNNKELATVLAKLCVQYFKGTPVKKLVNEKLLLDIYDFKTNWEQLKHDLSLLNLATSIN